MIVKVATFNIQQLHDLGPKTWWDQANRASRIPTALRSHFCGNNESADCPDVLILNEAFNSYAVAIAMELRDMFPYQTPVVGKSLAGWKSTTGAFRNGYTVINGGVVILSRHEIVEQRQYLYQATHPSTWDCWANKGVAYAKIQIDEQIQSDYPNQNNVVVHILGTHLQADEGHVPYDDTHQVRMTQLREMRRFLVEELKIPKTERVIIGGDLNVEYTTERYRNDLQLNLQAKIYYEHKLPGSFSAPHNWMTKANARANGQPEDRNETLDYVLFPSDYAQPIKEPMASVVPIKAAESWYWRYLAQQWPDSKGMNSDLSDHYPVIATFEF